MKILICTQTANIMQREYLCNLLANLEPTSHDVSLALLTKNPATKAKNGVVLALLAGPLNLFVFALYSVAVRLGRFLPQGWAITKTLTADAIAKAFQVPYRTFDSVNSKAFIAHVREQSFDLIVNNHPEIYKAEAIASPRVGILNVHIGALPRYRSAMPVFWAMMDGEQRHGVTLHLIEEAIDAGRLVLQEEFAIQARAMMPIILELGRHCAAMVPKALDVLEASPPDALPLLTKEGYRRYPSVNDVLNFWKKGFRPGIIPLFIRKAKLPNSKTAVPSHGR